MTMLSSIMDISRERFDNSTMMGMSMILSTMGSYRETQHKLTIQVQKVHNKAKQAQHSWGYG